MIIALDAMGGDYAPSVTVAGALEAVAEKRDVGIILVGDEHEIARELQGKTYPSDRLVVRHASEVVSMHESPSSALRKRKDSSIAVAVDLVRDKKADAVVSAGHSGVAMAMCLVKLGKAPGVDRPAIATLMPTLKSPFVLIDAGANVDCDAKNLLEFGLMGSAYYTAVFEKASPTVAIMSIGEEDTKGNEVTKEAFKLLKESSLNFIGNIEGKDVFKGTADVVVCDGFIGNVTLKICEGLSEAVMMMLREDLSGNVRGMLGYLLMKPSLRKLKKKTDYDEYGGAPLLGINGAGIISHGRSSAKAIKNAIMVADRIAEKRVYEMITAYELREKHMRESDDA